MIMSQHEGSSPKQDFSQHQEHHNRAMSDAMNQVEISDAKTEKAEHDFSQATQKTCSQERLRVQQSSKVD